MRILAATSLIWLLSSGCSSPAPTSQGEEGADGGASQNHSTGGGSSGASSPTGENGGSGAPAGSGAGTSSGVAATGSPTQGTMGGSGSASGSSSGALVLFDAATGEGTPDDASLLDGMLPPRMDLGKGDGHDVIEIGDSWMLLAVTGIELSINRLSGQPYREYAVPGTQLLNGQIPGQYTQAKAANKDIKTVVMTAGGNDVLETGMSADCAAGGAACQMTLTKIGAGLATLWKQMSMDGVQDVIHIEYASYAGSGLKDPAANEKGLAAICDAVPAPLRCHLLNTDALVNHDLMADGIHPSAAACDRIGQAVIDMMKAQGMRR